MSLFLTAISLKFGYKSTIERHFFDIKNRNDLIVN